MRRATSFPTVNWLPLLYPENKEPEYIFERMGPSLEKRLPFVAFRKPNEQLLTAIFQSNANLNTTKDFEDSGFVFAPFSLKEGVVLIQPDEIFQTHTQKYVFGRDWKRN